MKIEIVKVDSGRFCFYPACKKESKYLTPKGRIRKGTIAAKFSHKNKVGRRIKEFSFFYCRTCIDQLLLDCRANLDSKLWVFK